MRRIALINQKGGVGKTTTSANLAAALAEAGRRVLVIDLDPQANLTMHLGCEVEDSQRSTYGVLVGDSKLEEALLETSTPSLRLLGSHIDLSGAEMELAGALGRESLLKDALDAWEEEARERDGKPPVDYLLVDCPPSLGLLSINGLVAAREAFIALQTEFFALQGMGKLVEIIELLRRRMNPDLAIGGILPCLYDSRLRLAREVLAEIRNYFPGRVFRSAIGTNVKLAEAPSYGQSIFQYAPESSGARDYRRFAREVMAQEPEHESLAHLGARRGIQDRGTPGGLVPFARGPASPAAAEPLASPEANPSPLADSKPPGPSRPPADTRKVVRSRGSQPQSDIFGGGLQI